MGVNAIAAHTRHYPNHLHSPYFSPALPSPDGSPRFFHLTQGKAGGKEEKKGTKVYVQAGTAELLWDQAKMLCRGMREEGVDVTLREVRRCAFVSPFLLVRDEAARSYANPTQLHLHRLQLPTRSCSGRSFAITGHVL